MEENNIIEYHPSMFRNHPVFFILCLILIFVFLSSCSKDKEFFESAEKEFNKGNINGAHELYNNFVKDYPTSKWRIIAERQIEKCEKIDTLKKTAELLEKDNKFLAAKKAYFEILKMNNNVIDTAIVFKKLQSLKKKFEIPKVILINRQNLTSSDGLYNFIKATIKNTGGCDIKNLEIFFTSVKKHSSLDSVKQLFDKVIDEHNSTFGKDDLYYIYDRKKEKYYKYLHHYAFINNLPIGQTITFETSRIPTIDFAELYLIQNNLDVKNKSDDSDMLIRHLFKRFGNLGENFLWKIK